MSSDSLLRQGCAPMVRAGRDNLSLSCFDAPMSCLRSAFVRNEGSELGTMITDRIYHPDHSILVA